SVRVWDIESGTPVGKPFEGHTYSVWSVAFSPDGRRIVSGSDDQSVRIWDAESGKPVGKPLEGHTDSVTSVVFSPDGSRIVSGSSDKSVRVWDAQSPVAKQPPPLSLSPSVLTFCSHPDHYLPYHQLPFSTFFLTTEGWLCGSNSLLLWIPLEYRQTLLVPPLQLVISNAELATLNFQNFAHGFGWVK
ncbi:WD40-repeat-containing domain protein, partial [Rhodocollybia butyracea]